MSEPIGVDIRDIDKDLRPASLMRAEMDEEAIESYAEAIEKMPPVKLTYDPETGKHWVDDGAHTIKASRKRKINQVRAIVTTGTYLESFHRACHANMAHGVRITHKDKRRRVEQALEVLKTAPQWPWSDRRIAEWCGVSHPLVASLRPQLETVSSSEPTKTTGRDDKARKSRKERKPKDEPAPDPEPAPQDNGEHVAETTADKINASKVFDHEKAWAKTEREIRDLVASWPEDQWGWLAMRLERLALTLQDEAGVTTQEFSIPLTQGADDD